MSKFLQIHVLTSYPPANLNRDDLGRPKTAMVGGVQRLRVSSQSLKRAWRESDRFVEALAGAQGVRTKLFAHDWVYEPLVARGVSAKVAKDTAEAVGKAFAKLKPSKKDKNEKEEPGEEGTKNKKGPKYGEVEQLVFLGPEERQAIDALVDQVVESGTRPEGDALALLRAKPKAADMALFGRMVADSPAFNVEAAAQVAHAITIHKSAVEDDYFSAVDDLNKHEEDAGAAHIGELGFGAGVFYLYVCIDRELLAENLGGDTALVSRTLRALVEAVAKVAPSGKQNSFASRAYASYVLAEKGDQQPRSLSVAFVRPVGAGDVLTEGIKNLREQEQRFEAVYGTQNEKAMEVDTTKDDGGSFEALLDFVADLSAATAEA